MLQVLNKCKYLSQPINAHIDFLNRIVIFTIFLQPFQSISKTASYGIVPLTVKLLFDSNVYRFHMSQSMKNLKNNLLMTEKYKFKDHRKNKSSGLTQSKNLSYVSNLYRLNLCLHQQFKFDIEN